MSDWRGHLHFGFWAQLPFFFLLIAALLYFNNSYLTLTPLELATGLLTMIIAPLLPDLDHRSSKITNVSSVITIIGVWIALYFESALFVHLLTILTIIILVSTFTKHRGITHHYWIYIVFALIMFFMTGLIMSSIILVIGAWSHIWLDKTKH